VHSEYPTDPQVRRESEALLSAGWLLDIVCLRDPGELRNEKWEQGGIHRLPGNRRWGSGLGAYLLEYVVFFVLTAAYGSWLSLRHHYFLIRWGVDSRMTKSLALGVTTDEGRT
jgi:hypothetical protein